MPVLPILAASFWNGWIFSVILMVIGFGLMIFVHELGHFLVAKWVGIKVERFAIGFGKSLLAFTRGETEYCLKAIPLGGYVKMLGQDDFNLKEDEAADPRAYNNKPIWARLCVISAGVVMNIIFAAILFIAVFMAGINFSAPIVGDTMPGTPASMVETPGGVIGLQPGDHILSIDGKEIRKLDKVQMAGLLSDKDELFRMRISRPKADGTFEEFDVDLKTADTNGSGRYQFGIASAADREVKKYNKIKDLAYLGYAGYKRFRDDDVVVSFDGEPVEHGWQITQYSKDLSDRSVPIIVERKDGDSGEPEQVTITLSPMLIWSRPYIADYKQRSTVAVEKDDTPPELAPLNVLGMLPRVRIQGLTKGGPADKAGLQPGDVVVRYGDPPQVPTVKTMAMIAKDYIGKEIPIWVLRDGQEIGPINAEPKKATQIIKGEKTTVGQIGVVPGADDRHLVIAGVLDDSPLAGQIPDGSRIVRIEEVLPQAATGPDEATALTSQPETAPAGKPAIFGEKATWADLIDALGKLEGKQVRFVYTSPGGDEERTKPISLAGFSREDYRFTVNLPLGPLQTHTQTYNPLTATAWGIDETGQFIVTVYAVLRQLVVGRVSPKELTGPIGIFHLGVRFGERGPVWIVWLLAIISANLAVINFLPLPIVDGGHAVLLVIEKVRGKPLSVKVQNVIQAVGLAMIAVVFVLITYQDIVRLITGNWG